MSVRLEYIQQASVRIRADLEHWGISQRQAAKHLGMAVSTLNAFLNFEYHRQHKTTLDRLLDCGIWSEETRRSIEFLRDYEKAAICGRIPRPDPEQA